MGVNRSVPEALEKPAKLGRKTDFKPEYIRQAKRLGRLGATDEEIAEFFEVATSTLYRWKLLYPEFSEALALAKNKANARVERALYKRAVGLAVPDFHVSNYQGKVTVTPIKKHFPPDTNAAATWLRLRDPERWGDAGNAGGDKLLNINITFAPEEPKKAIEVGGRDVQQLTEAAHE